MTAGNDTQRSRKLIFGCGYLGLRVATAWVAAGAEVFAITRDAARACVLRAVDISPRVANLLDPTTLSGLPDVDTVLFAVGHDRTQGDAVRKICVDGLRHALASLRTCPRRLIYVSSTGVYGQRGGVWVDEQSPCEPTRDGGRACRDAELVLSEHPYGRQAVILRLAGLYGPGRIPRRAQLAAGLPIQTPADGYLNLIHVDDAARAVLAAEDRAAPPAVYCVSDGHPVPRGDYFRQLAALLGAPQPTFAPPVADSHAAQRARASKRVRNGRMLTELNVELRYPSYRAGLAAIVAAELDDELP